MKLVRCSWHDFSNIEFYLFINLWPIPILITGYAIWKHVHTSSVERFSEKFDHKAVTYLIFFVGTHWFQKCNFWKNSLSPFWGRRGRWGQTTSKLKITKILNENPSKIDEILNLKIKPQTESMVRPRPRKTSPMHLVVGRLTAAHAYNGQGGITHSRLSQ